MWYLEGINQGWEVGRGGGCPADVPCHMQSAAQDPHGGVEAPTYNDRIALIVIELILFGLSRFPLTKPLRKEVLDIACHTQLAVAELHEKRQCIGDFPHRQPLFVRR